MLRGFRLVPLVPRTPIVTGTNGQHLSFLNMSQSNPKDTIRQQLRRQRNALSSQQVQQHSHRIVTTLRDSQLWQQARHVGLYLPINNEVDLTDLLNDDKCCYLPSVHDTMMQFHRHRNEMILNTTAYGLSQPAFVANHKRPQLDVCFLPLVGFDARGHRLGMGGGFYDRYFKDNQDTILVGVAHALQQCESLPIDPWDVKLHSILTEQNWITT